MNELASFSDLTKSVQKTLTEKAKKHNEDVGDDKRKRTTKAALGKVFLRGVGAYKQNPESVRPQVSSAEQWAYARVNSFLYVLKNLKFRGGKHDTDLLPKEHPLSSKNKNTNIEGINLRKVASYKASLDKAPIDTAWGWENGEKDKVLEKGWGTYKRAHLWFDPNKKESLSSYRLPIARLVDGDLKVVFRGVAAAMGAINGNKKQSTQGITSEEREKIYNVLKKYYESFSKEPPPLRVLDTSVGDIFVDKNPDRKDEERKVGDVDPTNFPKSGDDKKVSLRNSEYPLFPRSFAERIRLDYPSIWKKGGNIKGNDQYEILTKIQRENNGTPKTPSQEQAIRLREAWMARHLKDFRIAGVIAQIKWLGISSRGLQYMKDLVKEEMKKVDKKKKRSSDMDIKNFQMRSTTLHENGEKEYRFTTPDKMSFRFVSKTSSRSEDATDSDFHVIEGVASSTSIDSYGTEMSLMGLRSMKEQMDKGIPILPRHNSAMAGGVAEWDEVIGRTISSDIEMADVKKAGDNNRQYALVLRSQLYKDHKLTQELMKRLNRGEPIGQSIGGWFDEVRVLENKEGKIERVIVDKVTLDHVAITRAPANPDSDNLFSLRSTLIDKIKDTKMNDKTFESRHIKSVHEKDDCYIVEFVKANMTEKDKEYMEEYMEDEEKSIKEYKEESEDERAEHADEKEMMDHGDKEDKEMMGHADEEEKSSYKERGVVPFQELPVADPSTEWDWNTKAQDEILGEEKNWKMYRRAHLYVDGDGEKKSDYKLPIAKMIQGELALVYKGLSSAMAALNGARGGVKLSDEDRKAVYEVVKKYYNMFDRDVPELMAYKNYEEKMEEYNEEEKEMSEHEEEKIKEYKDEMEEKSDNTFANSQNVDNSIDKSISTIQNNNETPVEEDMTENDLKNLSELIQGSLEPLTKRLEELEARNHVQEISELDKLKMELEQKEAQIQRMISAPVRHGVHYRGGATPEEQLGEFDMLIRTAKADNEASYTVNMIERQKEKITDPKTSASELVDMLTATLRAAEVDGLIK